MLTDIENRITYSGNGNATEFAYQFKILDRTDIKVLLTDADGEEKLLTKDYYVDVEKNVVRYPGYAVGAEVPESELKMIPTGLLRCIIFASFDKVNITIWNGTIMENRHNI